MAAIPGAFREARYVRRNVAIGTANKVKKPLQLLAGERQMVVPPGRA